MQDELQPPEQIPQPPLPPQKKGASKMLFVAMALVMILFAVGLVVYLEGRQQLAQQVQSAQHPAITSEPTATP